ncbi:MAG: hypothetical protein KIS62_18545 [Ramlibacter sp.]|nr:hypothetical protein [Ramlibacter sp.]
MTRDELLAVVPVREFRGRPFYVRMADIPEPWRRQFMSSLIGSAIPAIEGEGDCAHSYDWRAWVQGRWNGHDGPSNV